MRDEIDKCLSIIERNADIVGEGVDRHCKLCGLGKIVDYKMNEIENSGLGSAAGKMNLSACDKCGHVQLFDPARVHDSEPK